MIKHKEKSKPLKPDYDSAAILRQQMETTVSEYEEALQLQTDVDYLWDCIVAFQAYDFRTISGLPFSYYLKVGRNGELTRELWVDRRENSKGITWSSVMLAFEKALHLKMEHKPVEKPKALGDIRGVSYLFPIFYRFGLISVPDEISKRLK